MAGWASFVECRSNSALRRFLCASAAVLVWLSLDASLVIADLCGWSPWQGPAMHRARLATTYLLPVFGFVVIWFLVRFVDEAPGPAAITSGWLGVAFIAGGAIFDLSMTLAFSPDLDEEGNLYVRRLLDTGHGIEFVYVHLLLTQALFVSLFCGVWLGFQRHRPILIASIRDAAPRGVVDFLKAATGGGHLTLRQWLLPLTLREAPMLYHSVWATAIAVVFGISVFRWYVGIEWIGLVEISQPLRVAIVLTSVTGALVLYFVHLWERCRSDAGIDSSCHTS